VTGPTVIDLSVRGALRALGWAMIFYRQNAWPLMAIAALPLVARLALVSRGRHQMTPAHAGEALEGAVALWRGVLVLAIAGLDLLPDTPWWQSIWPGAWTAQLAARLGGMSGHGVQWLAFCAGVALVIGSVAGVLRLMTLAGPLRWVLSRSGMRPQKAAARAEAIGFIVGNLITIPLTTLLMYAAVARAAICLRSWL
jgi:hypothetical protein